MNMHPHLTIELPQEELAEALRRRLQSFDVDTIEVDHHWEVRIHLLERNPESRVTNALHAIDDWLPDAGVDEARDYLCSLPGVGRKTAACVLLFAFGMHDIPVDTHVSRVGRRLGLFREGAGFDELHDAMLELTPAGAELELHVNLLRHGRRTCHARRPACEVCALRRMCPGRIV